MQGKGGKHEAGARTRTQLAKHRRIAAHHRCRYMSVPAHREQRNSAAVHSWECLQQGQEIFVNELDKRREMDFTMQMQEKHGVD